jgi:hypothetical protein
MGIGPKRLFKRYASTNNYPRNSLHKNVAFSRIAGSIALTAVDGATSTAKEAVDHDGYKGSSNGGDKLLQLR